MVTQLRPRDIGKSLHSGDKGLYSERMGAAENKPPWYAAGLAFECLHCGRCCAGPEEGHVWVRPAEIDAIAGFLSLSSQQMHQQYLRPVGLRYSIIEKPETKDCEFLDPTSDGAGSCRIYSVRPTQCRTWPFWAANLATPGAWARAGKRCKGINLGSVFSLEEIETRRRNTHE